MLRPSRPLTVWLLWLAIVLLPVRGWAATMPTAGGPMNPAAVAMAQAMQAMQVDPAERGQNQPCHTVSVAQGSASTCSLCDVCHGAVALALSLPPRMVSLPATRPPIEPAPAIERPVLAGPDRPPRLLLA